MNPNANKPVIADSHNVQRGGIPRGKSLIYYSRQDMESEKFGLEIAYNTLKRGGTCILVASSASPEYLKNNFKASGMNIDLFENRLIFVDAYSSLNGVPSKEKYIVPAPYDIYTLSKEIMRSLKELPPSTVVFGSLSAIMGLCGEKETVEAIRVWNMMAKLCGHILVYDFAARHYSNEILECMKKELFNADVCADGITQRTAFDQNIGMHNSDPMNENRNQGFSGR